MAKIPFYQRSPAAYRISVARCRFVRRWQNLRDVSKLADEKSAEFLPFVIYQNQSLIRRTLGDVDPALQNNKAVNLGLAAPHVDGKDFFLLDAGGELHRTPGLSARPDDQRRACIQRGRRRNVPDDQYDTLADTAHPAAHRGAPSSRRDGSVPR